jgi:hypothetical protein
MWEAVAHVARDPAAVAPEFGRAEALIAAAAIAASKSEIAHRVVEIFSAAPPASNTFPKTAPRQIINANPPKVFPTPFSIDFTTCIGSMPRKRPASIATINNDKKGLTFL